MSQDRGKVIEELGEWQGDLWVWKLGWRRDFFGWEVAIAAELNNLHLTVPISRNLEDEWIWTADTSNSGYKLLQTKCGNQETVQGLDGLIFKHFWKSKAPTKGGQSTLCAFCAGSQKSANHLFLSCPLTSQVWINIFAWLGQHVALPSNIAELYLQFGGIFQGRKDHGSGSRSLVGGSLVSLIGVCVL